MFLIFVIYMKEKKYMDFVWFMDDVVILWDVGWKLGGIMVYIY